MFVQKEVEIGGKKLLIETGRFAKQANGSVMVRYGDTMVLVTAVASEEAKEDMGFFPLQVEYREKTSAKKLRPRVSFPVALLKGKEDHRKKKY